jgi:phosphatidylserine/phosphatidylglycerophosphate/cardiolipin synthase-like enzyme
MKKIICIIILLFSIETVNALDIVSKGSVSLYASPRGGATQAIVNEINGAKKEILIQAYSYTSIPIKKSIQEAFNRGIVVVVILDKAQQHFKYFSPCSGPKTYLDGKHKIAHNKIIIIDKEIVITGSFNFSNGAENYNAENLLIFKGNQELTNWYIDNFNLHLLHSIEYKCNNLN